MKKLLIFIITLTTLVYTSTTAYSITFSDVDTSNPYYISVTYLSENNIIDGYPDGSYRPFNNINRAELLKLLIEGAGIELIEPETNCFPDVPYTEWYAPHVCTAKELGYIQGYPDGTFKPTQNVNKVEAIKMVGEIYDWTLEEASDTEIFSDTNKNDWYGPYIQYAKMINVLPESGNYYNPSDYITRGNIAETLYRYLSMIEQGETIYSSTVFDETLSALNLESEGVLRFEEAPPLTSISGIISDALTGNELESATITLYDQNNNYIANTKSDSEGLFELNDIPDNNTNYLLFSKEDYYTLQIPLNEIKDKTIHTSLSRTFTQLSPGEIRIVLTWGETENDFDAHLIGPDDEEIFFMYRLYSDISAILDTDSTEKNGTETITIRELKEGTYEYFVHNYSGENSFKESEARIEVYDNNGLAKIYYPERGSDIIWKVFTLNEKGEILDSNEIGNCELLDKPSSICP